MFDTKNEDRFFKMLSLAPDLKRFWNEKERTPQMKSIQIALTRMDEEESALLRFFVSVWFGTADMSDFDFIKSVKVMDEQARKIIRKWLLDPFFC